MKRVIILLFSALIPFVTLASELAADSSKINKILNPVSGLKISGYFQAQWDLAQEEGQLGVTDSYNFPENSDNKFSMRRTRIKFDYTYGIVRAVVQFDAGHSKMSLKDSYIEATSKSNVISGRIGVFNLPFGHEIGYSSTKRETPERSHMYLTLFPEMRDIGAQLSLRGKDNTYLSKFKLDMGVFNGAANSVEFDSHKDFSGHLTYNENIGCFDLGLGTSIYSGAVLNSQNTNLYFSKETNSYETRSDVLGTYSPRNYYGFDAQLKGNWSWGSTEVRADYIFGTQQGTSWYSISQTSLSTQTLYQRNFKGYSVYFVQAFEKCPVSIVSRLDKFDPNRDANESTFTSTNSNIGDIAFTSLGGGIYYKINKAFSLMAYYSKTWNDTADHLYSLDYDYTYNYDYRTDAKDNLLTIRFQVAF